MIPYIRERADIQEPLKTRVLQMSPGQLKTAFAKWHKTNDLSFPPDEAYPATNWMASVPMAILDW